MLLKLALAGALLLVVQSSALAHPIVIDDFSQAVTHLVLTSDPVTGTASGTEAGLNVLGGTRTTQIDTTTQAIPGFDTATVSYRSSGVGFMDSASQVGWAGEIQLGYILTGEPSALAGAIGLLIEILDYDDPGDEPMAVSVLLEPGGGGSVSQGPESLALGGAQTLQVLFPDDVELDSVDALALLFAVPAGGDFRIGSIKTVVPEPSTMLLVALGLIGLARAGGVRRAG